MSVWSAASWTSVLSNRVTMQVRSRLPKYGDAASDETVPIITRSNEPRSPSPASQRALSAAATSVTDGAASVRSSASTASTPVRVPTDAISLAATPVTTVPARAEDGASKAADFAWPTASDPRAKRCDERLHGTGRRFEHERAGQLPGVGRSDSAARRDDTVERRKRRCIGSGALIAVEPRKRDGRALVSEAISDRGRNQAAARARLG